MSGDPIDEYLAALHAGLRTTPARTAEILAEAEDHLRESAAVALRAGHLSEAAAQRAAIEAFGPVKAVTRAHRPTVGAFAATMAMKAWPLLATYVLLTALVAGLQLWADGGRSIVRLTVSWHGRKITEFAPSKVDTGQVAACFGGCVLFGALVLAGFLIIRRHGYLSGLAQVRLPRGLFPLAAAVVLIVFGSFYPTVGQLGWLPNVSGIYEIASGSQEAALLLGVSCVIWLLVGLTSDPAGSAGHRAARRPSASASAAAAGLAACQLLGGYLLVSALVSGILVYVDDIPERSGMGQATAIVCGCAVAGVLLVAGPLLVRRRRRVPVRLPPLLSLLASAIALLSLGVAEYELFVHDIVGGLMATNWPVANVLLGSQLAAAFVGVAWVLRAVVFVAQWALTSRRSPRRGTPSENADLAPAG